MIAEKRAVIIRCFLKSYLKNLDNNPVPIPSSNTAASIIVPNKLTNKFILSQNLRFKLNYNFKNNQRIII